MMLGRIFEGRLGQFMAPDPNISNSENQDDEVTKSSSRSWSIMEVLAPDPNYYGEETKHSDTSTTASTVYSTPPPKENATDVFVSENSMDSSDIDDMATATSELNVSSPQDKLQHHVLSAARATAFALKSPTSLWEERKNFFNLCCSVKPLSEKQMKRMKRLLNKNPTLATSYSTEMGSLVPDGFTPLHAAARAGNLQAATVLLDFEIPMESDVVLSNISEDDEKTNESKTNSMEDADTSLPQTETPPQKMKKLVSLQTTDLQGRQPLHVASKYGHTKLVTLFRNRLKEELNGVDPIGTQAPLDLTGRTPLGWACASREKNAHKNRKELEKELFSPGDASICGPFSPPLERNSVRKSTKSERKRLDTVRIQTEQNNKQYEDNGGISELVEFGYAEMAGFRVEMEDALCCHYPVLLGDVGESESDAEEEMNVEEVGLFGVFDGHGDGGEVSRFIADNLLPTLQKEWLQFKSNQQADEQDDENKEKKAEVEDPLEKSEEVLVNVAFELDDLLYEQNIPRQGGSTGVFALLKKNELIVANVGDSRAILVVEKGEPKEDQGLAQTTAEKTTEHMDNNNGNKEDGHSTISHPIQVVALSEDHKPNLPAEKERIEKAGMKVIAETYENTTFHKIQLGKSPNTKIAVSRAFGDFDFKDNEDLSLEEQAITCVPEIITYQRSKRDHFLIMACDGVWDVMSSEDVGQFVYGKWVGGETVLAKIGDELLNECLTRGSRDNMTVLIVRVFYDEVKERLNFE